MSLIQDLLRKALKMEPPRTFISEPAIFITPSGDLVLDAGDAMCGVFQVKVPVSGIIQGATLYDPSDVLSGGVNVALCRARIAGGTVDAAFALVDDDLVNVIYQLNFVTFFDMTNGLVSSIENIGKRYRVPPEAPGGKMGIMYCQAATVGAATIVAGSHPSLRLEIDPDEHVD